jgi:AraC-like DNA-binding protein
MTMNGHPAVSYSRMTPAEFAYRVGEIEPEHTHSRHQFVHADHGLLLVDTHSSRWIVPPLRAVWVPAGTPHVVTAQANSLMSTLYIDPSAASDMAGAVSVVSVSPLLRELVHHLQRHPPSGDARMRLEGVILDQITAAEAAPLDLPRLHDQRVRAVADALNENPRDRRTLREFGREVGANERTLQRLFRMETGTTFGRWRTQLRLQHGVIALAQGRTVTSAATSSGYAEPSAFIAAFRSAFGTTPGRYFART